MPEATIIIAFIAGLISFFSPCILPLLPGFLAYLAGTKLAEAKDARLKIFLNSLAYVLGFSIVFSIFGILLSTALVQISLAVQTWLSRIGGIIIMAFGFYTLGILKLPFLDREYVLQPTKKFSVTYVTSFVFGASFALGWTPCIGAVLGSVLTLAASNPTIGFFLLLSYSLGLGLPFLLVGLFAEKALKFIHGFGPAFKYFNTVVGILLIILGILMFTSTISYISNVKQLISAMPFF